MAYIYYPLNINKNLNISVGSDGNIFVVYVPLIRLYTREEAKMWIGAMHPVHPTNN